VEIFVCPANVPEEEYEPRDNVATINLGYRNADANAALIAAAPETKRQRDELLEACEYVDYAGPTPDEMADLSYDDIVTVAMTAKGLRDLRAAIANATR
jgi:hypothetical protein